MRMIPLAALALALLVDRLFGEPPNALHPVAWMGTVTTFLVRRAPERSAAGQLAYGAVVAIVVPLGFTAAAAALVAAVARWPIVGFVVTVAILKPMFAVRALGGAAAVVRDALAAGDIGRARLGLRSLCSRDPETLGPPLLVAATVESLAENTSDSVVAPLLYYACFGIPGIVAYRACNTLDAMIGYHGKYEYLGKTAARIDDVLNLIPARITAGLLLVAGWSCGADPRRGWRVLLRDGGKTESPNAGRPMAAMAGLLGVELEKVGHYRLGDPEMELEPAIIDDARKVADRASLLAALLAGLVIGVEHAF